MCFLEQDNEFDYNVTGKLHISGESWRKILLNILQEDKLDKKGPVAWTSRSPFWNVLDSVLCGCVKLGLCHGSWGIRDQLDVTIY